jgi:hypothetical protein
LLESDVKLARSLDKTGDDTVPSFRQSTFR